MAGPGMYVNGEPADPAQIIMPVTISHGRSRADTQPDAPDMTVIWKSTETAPVQGDELRYVVSAATSEIPPTYDDARVLYDDPRVTYGGTWITEVTRFVGIVTDVDTAEYAGNPANVRVVAVNRQADLGRVHVLLSRPAESDIARIQAIAAAAGVPVAVHGTAGPMLAADEIDRDALAAMQEVCVSSGGLLWSGKDGVMQYGTGNHRAVSAPVAAIGAHAIISGITWQTTLADLINRVTMRFGPDGSQSQHTVSDSASIAEYGIRDTSVTTLLQDQSAADQLGVLIMTRRSTPFARISDVLFDSDHVSGDSAALSAALHLRVSDAVLLPIPADPGPSGTLAEWIVEGWQEEWTRPDHVRLQIAVTDRARFAQTTLRFWSHAATYSWQDELDRGAWLDTLILKAGES